MSSTIAAARSRRLLLQFAIVPLVAAVVALGVWVAGGVLTDDFRGSVALTTAWLSVAAGLSVLVARRSRTLRVPVISAYLLTAAAITLVLASTTLRDRVASERVVTGISPSEVPRTAAGAPASPPQNVRVARGRFVAGEHATHGTATIVRLADHRMFLTLTAFATSPGPDLRVRLTTSRTLDGGASDVIDLGGLKGNRGNQQYRVPARANLHGRAVVIWCRAFSARFGSAVLAPPAS
jgi:Electron transfer DM13